MNKDVIWSKIELMKRFVNRIEKKTPECVEDLIEDDEAQDIILINLERSVQKCVEIAAYILADQDTPPPMSMSESFPLLQISGIISQEIAEKMQKSIGFRKIAQLDYESINWNVVYSIITCNLNDFRSYAREIMQWF